MAKINAIDIDIETGGGNTYTFPSATSTLATLSLAETLTNKDLSAASNTLGSANVTAAGALMDSELTSIADVKALNQSVVSGAAPVFDGTNFTNIPTGTVDVVSNVATARILGRTTAGSGDSEELTAAATRTLLNVEDGATADQTGAQIKTAYEAEANAFTDTKNTKLSGIESGADVTDATNVTAAGALMESEVTNLAQVKAFDTTDYVTPTGTETLTNKRINKRTSTTTSTATLTPSPANYDVYTLTAQAGALTIANPTGTINIGDTIAIYVYTAAAQTLTFGTYYEAYSAALPTTTTAGKKMLITLQADTATTLSVLSAVQQ